jgi:hypothetical protein
MIAKHRDVPQLFHLCISQRHIWASPGHHVIGVRISRYLSRRKNTLHGNMAFCIRHHGILESICKEERHCISLSYEFFFFFGPFLPTPADELLGIVWEQHHDTHSLHILCILALL